MHAPVHVLIACLSESGEALEKATEGAEGMDHRAAQGSKSRYQIGCACRAGQCHRCCGQTKAVKFSGCILLQLNCSQVN